MSNRDLRIILLIIAVINLLIFSGRNICWALDFYPTIILHGMLGQPDHLTHLANKISMRPGQCYPTSIYAGDTDDFVSNSQPKDTIYLFGYYKERASDPGQYGYIGKIGGLPGSYGADYDNRVSYAYQLKRAVDNILRATGATKVNIVAHCLGGRAFSGENFRTYHHADQTLNRYRLLLCLLHPSFL